MTPLLFWLSAAAHLMLVPGSRVAAPSSGPGWRREWRAPSIHCTPSMGAQQDAAGCQPLLLVCESERRRCVHLHGAACTSVLVTGKPRRACMRQGLMSVVVACSVRASCTGRAWWVNPLVTAHTLRSSIGGRARAVMVVGEPAGRQQVNRQHGRQWATGAVYSSRWWRVQQVVVACSGGALCAQGLPHPRGRVCPARDGVQGPLWCQVRSGVCWGLPHSGGAVGGETAGGVPSGRTHARG